MTVPTLQWKIHGENFMQRSLRNSGIAMTVYLKESLGCSSYKLVANSSTLLNYTLVAEGLHLPLFIFVKGLTPKKGWSLCMMCNPHIIRSMKSRGVKYLVARQLMPAG